MKASLAVRMSWWVHAALGLRWIFKNDHDVEEAIKRCLSNCGPMTRDQIWRWMGIPRQRLSLLMHNLSQRGVIVSEWRSAAKGQPKTKVYSLDF